MARGPKKHLKRLAAPKHWMLAKLGGTFAPRPSTGPHKLRECLPLVIFLRNRLNYALTYKEAIQIVKQRLIKVDGKVRTDVTYPAGFMDVVTMEKNREPDRNFRLIYDPKGRYAVHRISPEEAKFKLCKVQKVGVGKKGVPYINTHDGRTIRYPDPRVGLHDSVVFDIANGRITDYVKFETGMTVMVTGGHNVGRVGQVMSRERHPGSFDIVHLKDSHGGTFTTRLSNCFVIGKANKPIISLPPGRGIRLSIAEERDNRLSRKTAH